MQPRNAVLRARKARVQLFFGGDASPGSPGHVKLSGRLPEADEDADEDGENQVQAQGHDQNAPYCPGVEARAELSVQAHGRLPRQTFVDFVDGVVRLLHGHWPEEGGSAHSGRVLAVRHVEVDGHGVGFCRGIRLEKQQHVFSVK